MQSLLTRLFACFSGPLQMPPEAETVQRSHPALLESTTAAARSSPPSLGMQLGPGSQKAGSNGSMQTLPASSAVKSAISRPQEPVKSVAAPFEQVAARSSPATALQPMVERPVSVVHSNAEKEDREEEEDEEGRSGFDSDEEWDTWDGPKKDSLITAQKDEDTLEDDYVEEDSKGDALLPENSSAVVAHYKEGWDDSEDWDAEEDWDKKNNEIEQDNQKDDDWDKKDDDWGNAADDWKDEKDDDWDNEKDNDWDKKKDDDWDRNYDGTSATGFSDEINLEDMIRETMQQAGENALPPITQLNTSLSEKLREANGSSPIQNSSYNPFMNPLGMESSFSSSPYEMNDQMYSPVVTVEPEDNANEEEEDFFAGMAPSIKPAEKLVVDEVKSIEKAKTKLALSDEEEEDGSMSLSMSEDLGDLDDLELEAEW